jgi:hypothetical protein
MNNLAENLSGLDLFLNTDFMRFAGGTLENFRQECTRIYEALKHACPA